MESRAWLRHDLQWLQVEAFAESNTIPPAAAVAYSIAHELSHLNRRSARHPSGIMQPLPDPRQRVEDGAGHSGVHRQRREIKIRKMRNRE